MPVMKKLLALLAMLAAFLSGPAAAQPVTEDEAYAIGIEAYTYAYPLVLMETTRRVSTNAGSPGRLRAPVNHFANMKTYPDASFKDVVRPNADTLYSSMWFDVGKEPLVLTLPNTQGRYHVIPLMDMWTDVFATLGTRTRLVTHLDVPRPKIDATLAAFERYYAVKKHASTLFSAPKP
eukprot:gene9741-12359_t